MSFYKELETIQKNLIQEKIGGWLLYDYHGLNPFAYLILRIPSEKLLTRRFFYWIPQQGEPIKIVSCVEPYALEHLPGLTWTYRHWQEMEAFLFRIASEASSIAMEYSPYNRLPSISKVDAGTVELVRRHGTEVVSSANLLQTYTSVWTLNQFEDHLEAAGVLQTVVELTWNFIVQKITCREPLTEWDVQRFMMEEIKKKGCISADPPICAVNEHSADPHYTPDRETGASIKLGDWILLDVWCKKNTPNAVYADITRVGVLADRPTSKQQEIFSIVKQAQETATRFIQERYRTKQPIQGWEVDQACRETIQAFGYDAYFSHRTGHNIGIDVHGPGANFDCLETQDFRLLLPGMCFSIEPGIYLPRLFGVRLEYDVYLKFDYQILITGGMQQTIKCLLEV